MYYVGIDFGTTNSSLCAIHIERGIPSPLKARELRGGYGLQSNLMPSLLNFQEDEKITIDAINDERPDRVLRSLKKYVLENPDQLVEMDGQHYSLHALIKIFLEQLLERASIKPKEIERLVLSVPVLYEERHKSVMKEACQQLGIDSERIWFVDEPVSIVWFYKESLQEWQKASKDGNFLHDLSLVFDFGGGTLDLAVVRPNNVLRSKQHAEGVEILAKVGVEVGGDDLDEVIMRCMFEQGQEQGNIACQRLDLQVFEDAKRMEKLRKHETYRRLKPIAEQAKIQLTYREKIEMQIPPLMPPVDMKGLVFSLTRDEFEKKAKHVWEKIKKEGFQELNNQLLERHKIELSKIRSVLLSGGSSQVPYVQDMLLEDDAVPQAYWKPDDQLQTSICCGNARYAAQETGIRVGDEQPDIIDIVNSAYGIYSHYDRDTVVVIEETDTIPVSNRKRIATTKPYQDTIEIRVMERKGSSFQPLRKNGKEIAFEFRIRPLAKVNDLSRFTLEYQIDTSQTLTVRAYDHHFGEEVETREIQL